MANNKLTLANADVEALQSNLRGEVGEIITTWLLMRHFIASGIQLRTEKSEPDLTDKREQFAHLMSDKLGDELVGRLSELAEKKIGQLTFHFAAMKIDALHKEVEAFEQFVIENKMRSKRNRDISHKIFPTTKHSREHLQIPYRTMVRAVAMALRLMKSIDRRLLGPSSPFLWREARKKRYEFLSPPRAGYLLVPYLKLSPEDRLRIVSLEQAEGKDVWTEMPTVINGRSTKLLACKQWGVVALDGRLLALDSYPLVALMSVDAGA
jgi:hypothetical protein